MTRILLCFLLVISMGANAQTTIISDNTWKGVGNWNAANGNAWLLQGYNDSAWPLVEAPNAANVIPVVPGSQSMWVLPYSDTAYMRKTFVVPVGDSYSGSISINADNEFTLYFNGSLQGSFNNWMGGPYTFNISPNLQGCVENVVAVKAANWGGPYGASLNTTLNVVNPLNTPVADTATNITCTSFTANWDSVATADFYLLDVSDDPNFATFFSVYNNFNVGNVLSHNVTGLTAGITYYYRVRAVRGALTSCYSNSIVFSPQFGLSVSSNAPVCAGEILALYGTFTGSAATFSWSGPQGFSSADDSTSVVNAQTNQSGLYILTVTIPGCAPIVDTLQAYIAPEYNFQLTNSLCTGSTIMIENTPVNTAGVYTFNYQSVFGCDSVRTYTVTEHPVYTDTIYAETCYDDPYLMPDGNYQDTSGIYFFDLSSYYGCDSLVYINLTVLDQETCRLIIPNVFTPNGDGINDVFEILGMRGVSNGLHIFNRWGQLLWETDNYLNDWNGTTLNGNKVPDGVYFYMFITSEGEKFRGHITIFHEK